jgi:organic hydroperoxide reductase OsmC/OhrA
MLWFLDLAARAGLVVDGYRDHAEGLLVSKALAAPARGEPQLVFEQITLQPVVSFAPGCVVSRRARGRLHHEAHERCFLANALRVSPRVRF